MKALDVYILGAAGFGGGELMRLLAGHPRVTRLRAISRRHAGRPVGDVHPHLRGVVDMAFEGSLEQRSMADSETVLFAAMPALAFAGQYAALERRWRKTGADGRLTVIDLSGDFRLADADAFRRHYGAEHPCPERLGSFAYGLSEWRPERLRGVRRIANPGCFATAVALALLPLAGLPSLGTVVVNGVTGSSGSGVTPGSRTHHPLRANDFSAYKALAHQHLGEIEELLAASGTGADIAFVPHSAPMVRGIFVTAHLDLKAVGLTAPRLVERYRRMADTSPFLRLVQESPGVAAVTGSNFCDLAVQCRGRHAVVMAALDNLGKGMAGQAVQNMNLAFGWDQTVGLKHASPYPA